MYTLRPYQEEAVEAGLSYFQSKRQKKPVLMVLPTGCHEKGTRVVKADGSLVPVEDVKEGDLLLSPTGQAQRVIELHRGSDDMYSITPCRGKPFVVNKGHIFSLRCTRERNNPDKIYPCIKLGGEIDNISVEDYLGKSKSWKHLRKLYRPEALEFPVERKQLLIPPYILGLMLGDGTFLYGNVAVTTMDAEIEAAIMGFAKDWGLRVRKSTKKDNKAFSLHLSKHEGKRKKSRSRVREAIIKLGLAEKGAGDKFIPYEYKTASMQDRLELLAGILDADGHLATGYFDHISKSEQLSADISFVARSLGYMVAHKLSYKKCQTSAGGYYHRISICGHIDRIPCRLPRKQSGKRKINKNPLVSGFSVEYAYTGQYYGFTLSGNHLYMTEDFIVHHNSGKSLVLSKIAKDCGEPVLIFQPTKEILEQNYEKLTDYGVLGVGVYSASAGRKDIDNITLATIGSVFRKPEFFKQFGHIIIDECHLVNAKAGMYKEFTDVVGEKLIGLSATPYRLNHDGFGGSMLKFLTRTRPRVFQRVIHVTQTRELSDQGFLSKNEYHALKGFNRRNIRVNSTGADYLDESVQEYYSTIGFSKRIVQVVDRLLEIGRKKILVFTKFVDEAEDLAKKIGDHCKVVHGEMHKKERAEVINSFRNGDTSVVTNVGVLSIGFDFPELDAVVLARPTRSLALYYQMIGRAVRPHPDKDKSMIVDLCGNINAFGRIEDLIITSEGHEKWYVESQGKQLTNVYLDEIQSL